MGKFNKFMEEKFLPVATKIGSLKYLVAIRDAFIAIMPITMVGSLAVLLNVFFRDIPTANGYESFVKTMDPLIQVNGNVWFASLAIISFVFVFALGYNIAKLNDVNALAGGIITFSAFFAVIPQVANFDFTFEGVEAGSMGALAKAGISGLVEAEGAVTMPISQWGFVDLNYAGSAGLFTALIIGLLAGIVYSALMKKKIGIKMPDSVPPAVSKAFAAIVPGIITVYLTALISYLVVRFTGQSVGDLILTYIQKPLLGLSQGVGAVIFMSFLIQLFWFFGIHGHNVLAPLMDGIYLPAQLENLAAHQAGAEMPYLWVRGSFDAYAQMGGSGVTIALIIAIFIFSKREDSRAVAKLSAPMGLFNINEPVTYGMPIVLNPFYIIPWLIIPPICVAVSYFFTAIGFIPPVYVTVPWITPPILYTYLATGGSFLAALVSLLNIVIAFFIYTPFVLMANKTADKEKNIK